MYQQNQIRRTLTSAEGFSQLQGVLALQDYQNRTQLGHKVCESFGFYDARGQEQVAGTLKVLRDLQSAQKIDLPVSSRTVRTVQVRRLERAVVLPQAVPARVDRVDGLVLELVESEAQLRLWNELVAREHPRGAVVHVGCQLRYLAVSGHGYLGAVGFAASALTLRSRDEWMGWDAQLRQRHLHRVVGLSRFLIRPGVACKNLASKVLGLCLRRLPVDFERRYGYRPYLVETFVEAHQSGVSFRASNWRHVGETSGRGRFGSASVDGGIKSVYVYELDKRWRDLLKIPRSRVVARAAGDGLDLGNWAEQEFGGAPLGDERLSKRLVKSAGIQARQPMSAFPGAAGKERAAVFGHYRLIDKPDGSQVTPQNIVAPHRQRTVERMQGCEEVLCIQDGTDLNFADHGGCQGLGLISRNKASAGTLGIHMHSLLVVNEQGVPLGVPHIQYGNLDDERKKTQRWVVGLQQSAALSAELDEVRVVSVMDREADCVEVFAAQRNLSGVELVVRAKHNRTQGQGKPKMFDAIRAQSAQAHLELPVSAQSARRSTRRQKARSKQSARLAKVELRWRTVQIGMRNACQPLYMNLVHVFEPQAPSGAQPLEWFLLTTLPVGTVDEASAVIQRYVLRWRIEDWHRILKSGCKVEFLAHRRGERIERAVTINAVIAWRLAAMTLLGRETPELPMKVLFSDIEIGVLQDSARYWGEKIPDNVGAGVIAMAMLAGYLNRKNDPPPGYKKIWEGYIKLVHMTEGYELALHILSNKKTDSWIHHKLSSD